MKKIEEGRRLLQYTDRSSSAAAAYLGFSNRGHFCRVNKEMISMAPVEYRKKAEISHQERFFSLLVFAILTA